MTLVAPTSSGDRGVAMAAPVGRMLLPRGHGLLMLYVAVGVAVALAPWYGNESAWIGVGIGVTILVGWHAIIASRTVPWLLGLVAATACIQWVLVPWVAYHVRAYYSLFEMAVPPAAFFSYTVPATIALVAGLYLPTLLQNASYGRTQRRIVSARDLVLTCEAMLWGGILLDLVPPGAVPAGAAFVVKLGGNLSWVGFFGLLLMRAKGWQWRAIVLLGIELAVASRDGIFHELLLWSAYFVCMLAFTLRVRTRWLLVTLVAAVGGVFIINVIKQEYRTAIAQSTLSIGSRLELLAGAIVGRIASPTATFDERWLSFNISRLNQGWIISRVILHVPAREPYAGGETVVTAVEAALVPRVLNPNKIRAGGHAYFERFTGLPLDAKTSMNLSIAGEMFANFGRSVGVLATFGFGVLIGGIFALFLRWSRHSILWWAWAPFVLLNATQAENGLAEALNHVTKALIVMFIITYTVPGWSVLRQWRLRWIRNRGVGAAAGPP